MARPAAQLSRLRSASPRGLDYGAQRASDLTPRSAPLCDESALRRPRLATNAGDDDSELEGLRGRLVKRKEHAGEEEGAWWTRQCQWTSGA